MGQRNCDPAGRISGHLLLQWAVFRQVPLQGPLVARIMLLSVVGTIGRHTMPSDPRRRVNLGRVIYRSIHSTTHDLAKPSSRRRDLKRSGRIRRAPNFIYSLCGWSSIAPAELGRLHPHAMEDDAQITRKSDFRALHAAPLCDSERPAFQARKANRSRQHDMGASKSAVRTMPSPTLLTPPSWSVSPD